MRRAQSRLQVILLDLPVQALAIDAEQARGLVLVAAALGKSGGNKNEAARLLGIDRQRLYRKIEKYHL